ncbi:tetratricopeptide repeat-containing protein [Variovorax sp. J22R115]|uniref:tetratricopeptide repeat-containing protein n=1 Tax=Variovorax sp. J22R115 TaxID=3053509 RepID=UPI002576470D|nr:tetratricopeptide repeat-containing protein [Variovorax sp. J22R115]MDM0053531.1 hypothetical protein [Variovorax sp. J22R115]
MRCFVIRGFGEKTDSRGQRIDFDKVDKALIAPALQECKLDGNTTAEVVGAGSIHQDMFQLILQEEFVLCDITVHNANVFYELGVRHALRKQRTVLIKGKQSADATPFDIAGVRYMTYDVNDPGAALEELVGVLKASLADDRVTDSPVFLMMPTLPEADFRSVATVPLDFAEEVQLAQSRADKGWLRLLVEDVRGERFQREGLRFIGRAQWNLKDFKVAAQTWEEVRSGGEDLEANLALANLYERLYKQTGDPGQLELSNQAIDRVLASPGLSPTHQAEAQALEGRNLKTLWRLDFASLGTLEERRERAIDPKAVESYEAYREAYRADLNHFFPGLAALQMGRILQSLAKEPSFPSLFGDDPKVAQRYADDLGAELDALEHVVRASIKRKISKEKADELIWAKIGVADLQFLAQWNAPPATSQISVVRAYRGVVPKGSFYWDAARGQLELFKQLGIGVATATAVMNELDGAPIQSGKRKRHLLVFSGHTVDKRGARQPKVSRLPASALDKAGVLIEAALKRFQDEGVELTVLASAAPGSDILALESCKTLGINTWLCLPMRREAIASEVFDQYEDAWRNRFFDLADAHAGPPARIFVMNDRAELPRWLAARRSMTPWSRGNRWMLRQAQAWGADRVTLLALWDGNEDDPSEDGTAGMVRLARRSGSFAIEFIDSRTLLTG